MTYVCKQFFHTLCIKFFPNNDIGHFLNLLVLLIFSIGIFGCSHAQHDLTNDPRLKNIANQCLEIQKESLVYEIGCGGISGSLIAPRCLTIQALGEHCFPETKEQFYADPKEWDKKMYRCGVAGRKLGIDVVDAGTQLKVIKISTTLGFELNRFWNITVIVKTGGLAGKEVVLPVYSSMSILGPKWFSPTRVYPDKNPVIPRPISEFITECEFPSEGIPTSS